MIELTQEQLKALEHLAGSPPRLVNPHTNETFVLLRAEEYERLQKQAYDDSPWTAEELQALAWETAERSNWEEYDEAVEKP